MLPNDIIDNFIKTLKDWRVVFGQYPIPNYAYATRKKKLIAIVAIATILNLLLGGRFMYLVDTTWVYDKVDRKKDQLSNRMIQYADVIDVSHQMVNNCYEAFYAVSERSTKNGCDFRSTVDSLTELNLERKILNLKLDQLLDGTETSWSKKQPL